MGLAANFPELKLPLLFALADNPLDENRPDRRKLQIEQFNCPICFHNHSQLHLGSVATWIVRRNRLATHR